MTSASGGRSSGSTREALATASTTDFQTDSDDIQLNVYRGTESNVIGRRGIPLLEAPVVRHCGSARQYPRWKARFGDVDHDVAPSLASRRVLKNTVPS
jgi:hypothetical protein